MGIFLGIMRLPPKLNEDRDVNLGAVYIFKPVHLVIMRMMMITIIIMVLTAQSGALSMTKVPEDLGRCSEKACF